MSDPTTTSDAAPSAASSAWTTRRLLGWIGDYLRERRVDTPRLVAEMLVAHVLGCERMRLYMEIDRPADAEELATLRGLVARAGRREPVHYLVGEAAFYWRTFHVGPCTLVPQPATEALVDHVLSRFGGTRRRAVDDEPGVPPSSAEPGPEAGDGPLLADVGTGTGCIAVTLAAQLPGARLVATDVSRDALELAARNAQRHGVEGRISFLADSLAEPLAASVGDTGRRFDAICANLPYVPHDEHAAMDPAVREHVPASAWDGGPDGLELIRPFVAAAPPLLAPGGLLALEIAHVHRDAALDLARRAGLTAVDVLPDHEGLWRVLVAETPG